MGAGFQQVLFIHASHIETCLTDIHDECWLFVSKAARDHSYYYIYKNIRRNTKLIEFHFCINFKLLSKDFSKYVSRYTLKRKSQSDNNSRIRLKPTCGKSTMLYHVNVA